jgi:type I restriction enzyme M protein
MTPAKAKANKQAVQELSAEYETGEQYVPVHDKAAALDTIFHDADVKYGLTMFASHELNALDLWKRGEKCYLHCLLRQKKVLAKPEEVVRQLCIKRLLDMGYAAGQMSLEVGIKMGSTVHSKAADIVLYREEIMRLTPYVIVELKRPNRKDGIDQLESYMNATGVLFGWWLNGKDTLVRYREEPNIFSSIDRIPNAGETIDDVRAPRRKKDLLPLVDLRGLVELLEERVLANAGVSAFDEIFKLIFAKLYDEHIHGDEEALLFRRGSETPQELYNRIQKLFVDATKHPGWNEIFDAAERIQLTPQALAPCVRELEKYRFFGSDLDVLDAAFEHLINPEQKGDKGQYFTPRHVVQMCVDMMNPRDNEACLDPACGPCGFMIHTLKHVTESESFKRRWGSEADFRKKEYAQNFLYAIDFDNKLAKVAKVMMLIMGDGKTHVFRVSSLDPREWQNHPHRVGDFIQDGTFDIVMTNPPFAGEITQAEVLGGYDLAYKGDPTKNKRANKVERDVLFIERCLRFLKPGGRMAIVLPQGVFNNTSDEYIRKYVMKHARILAVVGLQGNMFKPFTGTKTSVLFLQKWQDDGERISAGDYRIFFATNQKSGKDNSGEYIWLDKETNERVHDIAGKVIGEQLTLNHDLHEIVGAFKVFAKEERLDFFA